ncbi:hypothetical protein Moror_13305 [Moniliophthora roreri MCA 2997]|uniref:CFEM domain-containing protein n=1 Tax=Moniliophthora roreri (strain MCA 2997) TaxID=1381753 RepID=V2WVU6_MONRO|nr:hypothetical protein Moror_13305 [Moniliophthora roreri MCA 2997]
MPGITLQFKNLPLSFLLFLRIVSFTWGQASQAPPPETVTGSVTGTAIGTASSAASSGSASVSASATSSAPQSTMSLPPLGPYSPCVVNSFQKAVSDAGCDNLVPADCYCRSGNFTTQLISYIAQGCPQELATAESLSQQFCAIASTSTSLSFSVTSLSASSSAGQSNAPPAPTSSGASSPGGTNGAISPIDFAAGQGTILSLTVAFLGVLLGAAVI